MGFPSFTDTKLTKLIVQIAAAFPECLDHFLSWLKRGPYEREAYIVRERTEYEWEERFCTANKSICMAPCLHRGVNKCIQVSISSVQISSVT